METIHYVLIGIGVILLFASIVTVQQNTIAVVTLFGKYRRILTPGLSLRIPFFEVIFKRISIQNRSVELDFNAITIDQANVYFTAMLLYAVHDQNENTIKNVAFKFISNKDLMQALVRTIEGNIRSYVANKRQAEILGLRSDIVSYVKEEVDNVFEDWGYVLRDLQISDIRFDAAIMESMSRVVAANNLKLAAENEGQALLITKTKAAEADGNAIRIAAEAERIAAQLRGQGVAQFREEVARGMSSAAEEMRRANMDMNIILFSMWTEAIKNFAECDKGNVIFLDGSTEGMEKTLRQLMSIQKFETVKQNTEDKPKNN